MDFTRKVDKEFVDSILESSNWKAVDVKVLKEETKIEEESSQEVAEDSAQEEEVSFSLEDLQFVLDNLSEEDLLEHAETMLSVFDDAYETLQEGEDPGDEDEEEEEEEEEEDEVVSERQKFGGNKFDKSQTAPGDEDYTPKKGMKKTPKGRAYRK